MCVGWEGFHLNYSLIRHSWLLILTQLRTLRTIIGTYNEFFILNYNPKAAFGFMNKGKIRWFPWWKLIYSTLLAIIILIIESNHCWTKKNGIWVCRRLSIIAPFENYSSKLQNEQKIQHLLCWILLLCERNTKATWFKIVPSILYYANKKKSLNLSNWF